MRETGPHTTALTFNDCVGLADATTTRSCHSVGVKKMEETQTISGRTFHANQSSTPEDYLPLYLARLRTITVEDRFSISHCARDQSGSKKLSRSLNATPTVASGKRS